MFFEFKSISNFSMIGLLANSILPFASCLAKGTNNNDAKNNIIRIIMVTIFFVAKAYLLSSLKFYQGDVYLSLPDGIYECKISV